MAILEAGGRHIGSRSRLTRAVGRADCGSLPPTCPGVGSGGCCDARGGGPRSGETAHTARVGASSSVETAHAACVGGPGSGETGHTAPVGGPGSVETGHTAPVGGPGSVETAHA